MYKQSPMSRLLNAYLFRKSWTTAMVILALTIVVSSAIIALPHAHAVQPPNAMITINPTSQIFFSHSTIKVQGSYFAPNETVDVYWDYTGKRTLEYSVSTDSTGAFIKPFTLPLAAANTYTIAAVGNTSGSVATATFTMFPNLIASPRATGVGSSLSITGQAFGAGEQVNIYWDCQSNCTGNPLATATTDGTGSFKLSNTKIHPLKVPPGTYGRVPITGIGQSSGASALAKIVVYQLTLALAPLSGPPGTPLTISSYGFESREQVNVFWNNGSTPIFTAKTNDNGYFLAQIPYIVPAGTTPGTYSVTIVGSTSQMSITNNFTVTASSSSKVAKRLVTKHASANLDAGWPDFGFGPDHLRDNPFESTVNTTNVGNLSMKWKVSIGTAEPVGAPAGAPSPVYYNGTVYIATFDGILKAFDATTGTLKWQFDTQTTFANLSSPVVDPATNVIFFGTLGFLENQDHGVPSPFYAVDQNGNLLWSIILPSDDYGFPTLANNTIYVGMAGEGNGSLIALDETLGEIKWQYQPIPYSGVWGAVGIDLTNHSIFTGVGNPADQVVSLNPNTGQVHWIHQIKSVPGNDDDMGSGIAVYNSNGNVNVYADGKNGNMYAIGEKSTTATWITQIGPSSVGNVSSPAIDPKNGVVYVGSLNHYLYALDATNGAILWGGKGKLGKTGGQIYSSPALANGVVYVASNDGKFYAFDATNDATKGVMLWSYNTGHPTFSSPIMVDGMLYCASTDGNLYAFGL